MKIYIVGPLFSEAEEKQRKYEGERIRHILDLNHVDYELFNPVDMPFNSKEDVTSSEIALADVQRLNEAEAVFFDLSTEDSGSCVALGMMMEKLANGKKLKLYPVIHDIRLKRNSLGGLESSCGFNSMVVGILKGNKITIYSSFEEALQAFLHDHGWADLRLERIEDVAVEQSYSCYQSFDNDENGFQNDAYGLSMEEYKKFVERCVMDSKGIDLPDRKVPQTTYMLMENDHPVGIFKLRHYLNEALRNGAGHIGYGIVKKYRGKGYATMGLALMIQEAKKIIREDEIYFSVHKDNPASLKAQMKNGAWIDHEDDEQYFTRIALNGEGKKHV